MSSNRSEVIDKANITYSHLRNALEKQTEEQVGTINFSNLSKKVDFDLKQVESIFLKNILTNFIKTRALEIVKLQGIIRYSRL